MRALPLLLIAACSGASPVGSTNGAKPEGDGDSDSREVSDAGGDGDLDEVQPEPRYRRNHGCAFVRRYNEHCSGWSLPASLDGGDPIAREAEARRLYREGQNAFDLGEWSNAAEAFERAYVQKPLPALLFNIARAHERNRDIDCSIGAFRAFLDTRPAENLRQRAETLLAELERIQEQNREPGPCD